MTASWMNKFYMDDVQWKLPQLFYFTCNPEHMEAKLSDDKQREIGFSDEGGWRL
jgi:hypothetical protein